MTTLLHSYSPITVPEDFVPVFDPGPHTYEWRKWTMPGVSHLLTEFGLKDFDRNWYRGWLMEKKGVPEKHVDAEMAKAAIRGSEAHYSIEKMMMQQSLELDRDLPTAEWGEPPITHEQLRWFVTRAEQVMKELEVEEVLMVEQTLVHPVGHYSGTIDALVRTPKGLVALDWKTKESKAKLRHDKTNRYQLAAYLGAINNVCQNMATEDGEPIRVLRTANAYLAPDGYKLVQNEPEDVMKAWVEFQGLLYEYWEIRVNQGADFEQPELAQAAMACILERWGPFEDV